MTALSAAARRAPASDAAPGVRRDQLLDLIDRIAIVLPVRVSDGALKLLRLMAKFTPPREWDQPGADPCCYMQQTELCALLDRGPATVRRYERELSAARLIEKRTAANGARSGFVGCGIFFGATIRRVEEFRELASRIDAMREERAHLRGRRSIHKRHLRAALDALIGAGAPEAAQIATALQAWPSADQLHRMTVEALQTHVEEADALCRFAIQAAEELEKTIGRPLIFERPYIQDTTQEESVSCNASVNRRSAGKPAQDNLSAVAPTGATKCLEKNDAEGRAARNSDYIGRLGPRRLYALAGEDFRMYLDVRAAPDRLTFHDFVCAAQDVMRDRGINRSVWTDALQIMSEDDAMICALITDARCSDPRARVLSPGGYMRGMVRACERGELNLVQSLIGLSERRRVENDRC